ncbi:MAG: hypothetical protein V2B20_10080 [Pseudomonadota bacterium]
MLIYLVMFLTCQDGKAEEYNFDELSKAEKVKDNEQNIGLAGVSQKSLSRHVQTFNEEAIARRRAAEEERARLPTNASDSGVSASAYQYCSASDVCFQTTGKDDTHTYRILCTKGSYAGKENKICQNSKGNWAYGCGFSDAFAFRYDSSVKAGNAACW